VIHGRKNFADGLCIEVTGEFSGTCNADDAGFFADDKRHGVRCFTYADGGTVTGAKIAGDSIGLA